MIHHDSFTDASRLDMVDPEIAWAPPHWFKGLNNFLIILSFHLGH